MKEVTYEDWQKNPKVRMMWVWNSKVEDKVKRMVLFLTERNPSHPVIALTSDNITTANYKHCAEIEKQRRMTNQELAWWLQDRRHREIKYDCKRDDAEVECQYTYLDSNCNDAEVKCQYTYLDSKCNDAVPVGFLIRENGGEWHEPLVEVEEND